MAGRKQHYIPQAVQRSFEAARTGTKAQVLVFRKDRKAYLIATDGSAAERDFYSNPLTYGIGALDDKITDFEAAHLGPILQQLRSTSYGEVDSGLAAIAIAHLAFRTAHLRGSMAAIADDGLAQMQAVVADSQAFPRAHRESIFEYVLSNNPSLRASCVTSKPSFSTDLTAPVRHLCVKTRFGIDRIDDALIR
jgi:hypothetical protein